MKLLAWDTVFVLSHHYQLAQVNVARMRGPVDSPVMAEFVAQLPAVNALADHSPGFVWRLETSEGDATAVRACDDPLILFNLSVWRGYMTGWNPPQRQMRLPGPLEPVSAVAQRSEMTTVVGELL